MPVASLAMHTPPAISRAYRSIVAFYNPPQRTEKDQQIDPILNCKENLSSSASTSNSPTQCVSSQPLELLELSPQAPQDLTYITGLILELHTKVY